MIRHLHAALQWDDIPFAAVFRFTQTHIPEYFKFPRALFLKRGNVFRNHKGRKVKSREETLQFYITLKPKQVSRLAAADG